MLLKVELPIDCELFINSYDLDDFVSVVNPLKIHGVFLPENSDELDKMPRINLRIRQTSKHTIQSSK